MDEATQLRINAAVAVMKATHEHAMQGWINSLGELNILRTELERVAKENTDLKKKIEATPSAPPE